MRNNISGVYRITNLQTGDFYIGSSKNVKRRWAVHKCPSTWASKPNLRLYKAFQKYGLNNFKFEILEETTVEELRHREQHYIQTMKPSYNIMKAEVIIDYTEYMREWHKANAERWNEYQREWHKANADKFREYQREYNSRICLYNGEELTFSALRLRFRRAGIPHPTSEAKKYLKK